MERFARLLRDVGFPRFIYCVERDGDRYYLQIRFNAPDPESGETTLWNGRKWFLSEWMTDSEFVRTCFMATMAAVEHETRENFMYRGEPIFGPHISVEALVGVARLLDKRTA